MGFNSGFKGLKTDFVSCGKGKLSSGKGTPSQIYKLDVSWIRAS